MPLLEAFHSKNNLISPSSLHSAQFKNIKKNYQFHNKYSKTEKKSMHNKNKSFKHHMQVVAEQILPLHVCASFRSHIFRTCIVTIVLWRNHSNLFIALAMYASKF